MIRMNFRQGGDRGRKRTSAHENLKVLLKVRLKKIFSYDNLQTFLNPPIKILKILTLNKS